MEEVNMDKELKSCPVCRHSQCINYIVDVKHWFCLNCDTQFDDHQVIYVYDEMGELVEVITNRPDIWKRIKKNNWKKGLIRTVTV